MDVLAAIGRLACRCGIHARRVVVNWMPCEHIPLHTTVCTVDCARCGREFYKKELIGRNNSVIEIEF